MNTIIATLIPASGIASFGLVVFLIIGEYISQAKLKAHLRNNPKRG